MHLNHPLIEHIKSLKRQANASIIATLVIAISLTTIDFINPNIISIILTVIGITIAPILAIFFQYRYMLAISKDEPVYLLMLIGSGKDKHIHEHEDRLAELNNHRYSCFACLKEFNDAVSMCFHYYDVHRLLKF